jgi:two-component system, NtrC family, sensor kinase
MSLKKNIILSFLISSVIIVILAFASYVNFIEIRKVVRYMELSDTVRSKSLQFRRHEKNFLLYQDEKEMQSVRIYLKDLSDVIRKGSPVDSRGELQKLKAIIREYEGRLNRIENYAAEFHNEFNDLKRSHPRQALFSPIIESTFLERPMVNARLLAKLFSVPADAGIIRHLYEINLDIIELRKNGEEILDVSKELDTSAREKLERAISVLQTATLILLPLFFIVGLVTLFLISHSVVNRLRILTEAVKKTGQGNFASLAVPERHDEVGVLITAFNAMERDLLLREEELKKKKNEELLRSRKLASIGTLASGVAHELNNPLNNIYISAQILEKEAWNTSSPQVKEIVEDIVGQTIRVKRIVGDLLEFARGREPLREEIELDDLIRKAYKLAGVTADTGEIEFSLDTDPAGVVVNADPEQLERVFINLFNNAIDAMSGMGKLKVTVREREGGVVITVSDNGKGMSPEAVEKVFEPFYTTKDKGTGLGLAIVFNIVARHGGAIKVESREGQGSSFNITLPPGEIVHES